MPAGRMILKLMVSVEMPINTDWLPGVDTLDEYVDEQRKSFQSYPEGMMEYVTGTESPRTVEFTLKLMSDDD